LREIDIDVEEERMSLPVKLIRGLIITAVFAFLLGGVFTAYAASQGNSGTPNAQEDNKPVYLGVRVADTNDGVVVREIVSGSPAEVAGLEIGDVIQVFDGKTIENAAQLRELIQAKAPGDTVTLTVQRSGEALDVQVTLAEQPVESRVYAVNPRRGQSTFATRPYQLGVQYRELTPEIAQTEGLAVNEGAWVQEVVPDSPAADAGLQVGDVITAVDGDKVDIEHTLSDRLYAYEAQDRVNLTVVRGEETLEIGVVLATEHPDKQAGRAFPRSNIEIAPGYRGQVFPPGNIQIVPGQPINPEDLPFTPDIEIPFEPGTGSIQIVGPNIFHCTTEDGFEFQVILPGSVRSGEDQPELTLLEVLSRSGIQCESSLPSRQPANSDKPPTDNSPDL
jgi:membrane-associated protease RseP (regulator of RpoE activity)